METLPKKPGNTLGMTYTKGLAKCRADDCNRTTRSKHMKKADYPGTYTRQGRGMCHQCYERVLVVERRDLTELKFPILPCTVPACGAMTRSTRDRAELAPGTRRRISKGRCTECVKADRVVVPEEKVEAARTELDAFLAARQKRQAAAARRQAAQRFRVAS